MSPHHRSRCEISDIPGRRLASIRLLILVPFLAALSATAAPSHNPGVGTIPSPATVAAAQPNTPSLNTSAINSPPPTQQTPSDLRWDTFFKANWPKFLIGLVGAVFGTLFSSSLTLGVQHLLDVKRQAQAERQAAFVAFVGVTRICLGIDSFFRIIHAKHPEMKLPKWIKPPNGAYGPVEMFCAFIAFSYQVNPQAMSALSQRFAREEVARALDDIASNFGAAEDFGKLPRKVLLSYLMLQAAVTNLQVRYKMVVSAVERNDLKDLKAELFHSVAVAASNLIDRARELRAELIREKLVNKREAYALEKRMQKEVDATVLKTSKARDRLSEAVKITNALFFFSTAKKQLQEIAPGIRLEQLSDHSFDALDRPTQIKIVSELITWVKEAIVHQRNLKALMDDDISPGDLKETLADLERRAALLDEAQPA